MVGRPDDAAAIVVLCGAGLSVAAGVPRFHKKDHQWQGERVGELCTPDGLLNRLDSLRAFYDDCRAQLATTLPTPAHDAVARLQQRWGPERVSLVTQNIDSLLEKAGAPQVIEMYGSLMRVRCANDDEHPAISVPGLENRSLRCKLCGSHMRPDVTLYGEPPRHYERVRKLVSQCGFFVSVGASSKSKRAAQLAEVASQHGAHTIEINPKPSGGPFNDVITDPAADALARIVGEWLREETD